MKYSRRHSIKTFGKLSLGSMAFTPFMNHLAAQRTTGATPKRFLFVLKSSGLTEEHITPPAYRPFLESPVDKVIDKPLQSVALPETLTSLDPFKDKMTIVQRISGKMCATGHSGFYGALGAFKGSNTQKPIAHTIDGYLARKFPSVFNHVGLKMGNGSESVAYPSISSAGGDKQLPYQCNPMIAYMNLFGSIAESGDVQKKYAASGNILDFVSNDVKKLKRQLNGAEAEKLDYYLEGFDALKERRIKLTGMQKILNQNAPEVTDTFTSPTPTHHLEAHFDLAAATLISGLSNSISILCDDLQTNYDGIGIPGTVHGIGHGATIGEHNSEQCRDLIRKFHLELLSGLMHKLAKVPEGDGTMLDNTVIVYLSDNSDKHHSFANEWPLLLFGGKFNGRLKSTGRYLQYPDYGKQGHRTIGNFLTTIVQAAGLPDKHFGHLDLGLSDLNQEGPLHELLV